MWLPAWWFGTACGSSPPGPEEWARWQAVCTRCSGWAVQEGGAGPGCRGRLAPSTSGEMRSWTQHPTVHLLGHSSAPSSDSQPSHARNKCRSNVPVNPVLNKQKHPLSPVSQTLPNLFPAFGLLSHAMKRMFWNFPCAQCRKNSGNPSWESSDGLQVVLHKKVKSQVPGECPTPRLVPSTGLMSSPSPTPATS